LLLPLLSGKDFCLFAFVTTYDDDDDENKHSQGFSVY
jgi:hypothetical protein